MAASRFFVPTDLTPGETLVLPDNAAHHLSRVLRLAEGEPVVVFNGKGGEYHCVISRIDRKEVRLDVQSFNPANRTPDLPVHLGMSVIKKDAMDSVLARAAEMGVSEVTPVIADRSTVAHRIIRNRHDHWQQVLVSATEQCGMNQVPVLHPGITMGQWLQQTSAALRVIAVPGETTQVPSKAAPGDVALLIGPEGGFTDDELQAARAAGFEAMTLGSRVMRAETAPVALLTVIQHLWGEFTPG